MGELIVLGKTITYESLDNYLKNIQIFDIQKELINLDEAVAKTKKELESLQNNFLPETSFYKTINLYIDILNEEGLIKKIREVIVKNKIDITYAIAHFSSDFITYMLINYASKYKGQENAILSVLNKIGKNAYNHDSTVDYKEPVILLINELKMDIIQKVTPLFIKAIIAKNGSEITVVHNQIKMMGISIIYDSKLDDNYVDNKEVLIDVLRHEIIFSPSNKIKKSYEKIKDEYKYLTNNSRTFPNTINILNDKQARIHLKIYEAAELENINLKNYLSIGYLDVKRIFIESFSRNKEDIIGYFKNLANNLNGKHINFGISNFTKEEVALCGKDFLGIITENIDKLKEFTEIIFNCFTTPFSFVIGGVKNNDEFNTIRSFILKYVLEYNNIDYKYGLSIDSLELTHNLDRIKNADYLIIDCDELIIRLFQFDSLEDMPSEYYFDPLFIRMIKRIVDKAKENNRVCYLSGALLKINQLLPVLLAIGVEDFIVENKVDLAQFCLIEAKYVKKIINRLPELEALENSIEFINAIEKLE